MRAEKTIEPKKNRIQLLWEFNSYLTATGFAPGCGRDFLINGFLKNEIPETSRAFFDWYKRKQERTGRL